MPKLFRDTEDKKIDKKEMQKKAHEWALEELCKRDKKFSLDIAAAEFFLEKSDYDPDANSGDDENSDILTQYTKMIEKAYLGFDERISAPRKKPVSNTAEFIKSQKKHTK